MVFHRHQDQDHHHVSQKEPGFWDLGKREPREAGEQSGRKSALEPGDLVSRLSLGDPESAPYSLWKARTSAV